MELGLELALCMRHLQNLYWLQLRMDDPFRALLVFDLAVQWNLKLPKLESLDLTSCRINASNFARFLENHSHSLLRLGFDEVIMRQCSDTVWDPILQAIKKLPHLEYVMLRSLQVNFPELHDPYACEIDEDEDYFGVWPGEDDIEFDGRNKILL